MIQVYKLIWYRLEVCCFVRLMYTDGCSVCTEHQQCWLV